MSRKFLRMVFLLIALLSGASAAVNVHRIMQDPALLYLVERAQPEIEARLVRMIHQSATPERLEALITARLAQEPRDWLVLEALKDLAQTQGHPLPAAYHAAYHAAWEADSSYMAQASDCLACLWDITRCSTRQVLLCKAPIMLTPIEDARGLVQAGIDYIGGDPVDRLDLGLSVLGLGASAAVIASGGSSAMVKAGSALIKTARGMGRLSPKLLRLIEDGLRQGARRPEALPLLGAVLGDLGRSQANIGSRAMLHILPLVDDAQDARRLAKATQALGPRSLAALEVIGKSKLLRATLRLSDALIGLIAAVIGLCASLALLGATICQAALRRRIAAPWRAARHASQHGGFGPQ